MHPSGPKHDYDWHLYAMDRAMRAGSTTYLMRTASITKPETLALPIMQSIRKTLMSGRTQFRCRDCASYRLICRLPASVDDDSFRKLALSSGFSDTPA